MTYPPYGYGDPGTAPGPPQQQPAPWQQPPVYGYPAPPWATAPNGAPYGAPWGAPPPRRPWTRKAIALVAGGAVLAAVLLALVVVAGINAGQTDGAFADLAADPAAVATSPPSAATGLGDDAGLDGYAQRCHDGLLQACDDLYDLSKPLSDYEQYGMTCGGRVKPYDVAYCTDLE